METEHQTHTCKWKQSIRHTHANGNRASDAHAQMETENQTHTCKNGKRGNGNRGSDAHVQEWQRRIKSYLRVSFPVRDLGGDNVIPKVRIIVDGIRRVKNKEQVCVWQAPFLELDTAHLSQRRERAKEKEATEFGCHNVMVESAMHDHEL